MDINHLQNCSLTTCNVGDEIKIYDFIADKDYCFRNTSQPLTDDNGDVYFDHFTAFSLLSEEIDTLKDFECIPFEEGMVIH